MRGASVPGRSVDVVVVAYGAPDLLDRCLATLGGAFPVTVVDNSSDPEVQAVADRHGARWIDPQRNLGFGAGVNLALSARTPADPSDRGPDDVLLLNPDATIGADEVLELQRFLHDRPARGCVAPRQVDPTDGAEARVGWPFPTPLGAWVEAAGLGRLRRDDFMIGSILLLRADTLEDVGLFDEQFFLYAEETDWQRRAHDGGWEIALCPGVVATHVGAGTGGDATVRQTHFHASAERYIRKHYGRTGWWVFRSGVMAGSLARALVAPGQQSRRAADRFHLYRRGPCRVEAALDGPAS